MSPRYTVYNAEGEVHAVDGILDDALMASADDVGGYILNDSGVRVYWSVIA